MIFDEATWVFVYFKQEKIGARTQAEGNTLILDAVQRKKVKLGDRLELRAVDRSRKWKVRLIDTYSNAIGTFIIEEAWI